MPGSRAVARGSGSGCWIAPSILAADFARLGEDVAAMVAAGADLVHLDVMDNHYVPNLTVGPMVCRALRDYGIGAPLDVHLMVTPVDDLIRGFADAGAEYISFHPEASQHVDRSLALIEELGCKPGLALNPASPTVLLQEALPRLAMVLLMTVNPGFGGQEFMPRVLGKIKRVREMIDETGRGIRLEVDGGIKLDNVAAVAAAGADTLVAGSALFGAPDYAQAIAQMRAALALLPIREA